MSSNKIDGKDVFQEKFSDLESYFICKSCPLSGNHETQLAEGGEADLHTCFTNCTKNPDHKNFISYDTFDKRHLPDGIRSDFVYDLIKVSGDLTVRIGVSVVSLQRPQFWPTTNEPYPFYELRGQTTSRYGTGTVNGVAKVKQGDITGNIYDTCQCRKCQQSASPSTVWWEIQVQTAGHVIFDESEAKCTSCRLFFDGPTSPLVTIDAVGVRTIDVEKDWCQMRCVTCDPKLGKKLYNKWDACIEMWKKVPEENKKRRNDDRFTFIVAHPHGSHKYLSLGQWTDRFYIGQQEHYDVYRFNYTTDTCAGSSGAFVFNLGYIWSVHIHSGTADGLNYSRIGLDRLRDLNEAYTKMASLYIDKNHSKIKKCTSEVMISLDNSIKKFPNCLNRNLTSLTTQASVFFIFPIIPNVSNLMYSIETCKSNGDHQEGTDTTEQGGCINCSVTSECNFIDNKH